RRFSKLEEVHRLFALTYGRNTYWQVWWADHERAATAVLLSNQKRRFMQTVYSHSVGLKPAGVCLAALAMALLGACSTASTPDAASGAGKGQSAPVACLRANTGGDGMFAEPKRGYVLELHVLDGEHTVKPLAQCNRISGGDALGGGTKRELAVALCEGDEQSSGEYWLISEPGLVSVRRGP